MRHALPVLAALLLALAGCAMIAAALADPSDAHRAVSAYTAEQETYRKYNKWCGETAPGTTWCHRRQTALHSQPHPTLTHSWEVRYTWMEAKIGTTYGCGMTAVYNTHTRQVFRSRGPSCSTR